MELTQILQKALEIGGSDIFLIPGSAATAKVKGHLVQLTEEKLLPADTADMIREAYERCVNQTGKLSMKYMNRILERWQKEGIFTLRQAQQEKEEKAAAARRDQESRVSYDIDSFERSGAFDSFHR